MKEEEKGEQCGEEERGDLNAQYFDPETLLKGVSIASVLFGGLLFASCSYISSRLQRRFALLVFP